MPKLIQNKSGYQLQGSLTYDSVGDFIRKGLSLIRVDTDKVQIDCQQLSRIDSAGIALLISWQRHCEQNNSKFQLVNLPHQAISLIKANKLDRFFSF
jgi:phospholipid transport system transporter-binding protein